MTRNRPFFPGTILALAFCALGTGPLLAADAPATAPVPATTKAARTSKEIYQDIRDLQVEMRKDGPLPNFAVLSTAEDRARFARARESLVKLAALQDELSVDPPQMSMTPPGGPKAMLQGQRITYLALAASLENEDAAKQLAALAASADKEQSIAGKMGQHLVTWLLANKDAAAQAKVLDAIEALAKDNPASDALATNLRTLRAPSGQPPELSERIDALYLKTLTGPVAAGMQAYLDAGAKQKNALGKPILLAGKTSDGKDFSTKDYAGKVVLIDFWATWCGPCKAEMPKIKAVYEKYHAKGLEVVGISCDGDADALATYTKENNMPWVQLWDKEKQAGKPELMHALAVEWKLNGIPQMFLIDRTGTLRSVQGRKEFEELIPKLLDEK